MQTPTRPTPDTLKTDHTALRVLLIGAGGNGSEMLDGLMRLHQAIVTLGGEGLHVMVVDHDEVSESNCIRQRFWPTEIGMNKAVALVQRTNMFMGTAWEALPQKYNGETTRCDLVITAVDNLETRKMVARLGNDQGNYRTRNTLWLDMGCDKDKGQMILGKLQHMRLDDEWPNAAAHFDLLNLTGTPNRPSCSAADSLSRQDLMINQTVAGAATNLLWKAVRTGEIAYNGVMIDLERGSQQAIPFMPYEKGAA